MTDIARHYRENVEPDGFLAQMVIVDREAWVRYKEAVDWYLPNEASEIVITVGQGEGEWRQYARTRAPCAKIARSAEEVRRFLIERLPELKSIAEPTPGGIGSAGVRSSGR